MTAPQKPEKFDPIPREYHRRFWSDNSVFLSTLSQLDDLMKKKGPALKDKQLHSHARALDVLIATLFKRLYNFQSFRTFFLRWWWMECGDYYDTRRKIL